MKLSKNLITEWKIYSFCNTKIKILTIYFNLKLGDFIFLIPLLFIIFTLSVYFCFYQNAYITGILSQICLFTIILSSLKTNILPSDKMLYYHKFISMFLTFISLLHGLSSYNRQLDNKIISGYIFFIILIFNNLFSLSRFKDKYYHLFYYTHRLLYLMIIIMSLIHGKYRIFIIVGIYILDLIYRRYFRYNYINNYEIKLVSKNIIKIIYSNNKIQNYPAKYVYLCIPDISKFEFHPFSIANYSHNENVIYIRVVGDWTNKLKSLISNNQKYNLIIDGYYGNVAKYTLCYNYLLLIGLGIGITPLLSIIDYIHYVYTYKSFYNINKIYLVVSFESIDEFNIFIKPLYKKYNNLNDILHIDIYITKIFNNDTTLSNYNIYNYRIDIYHYLNIFDKFDNKAIILSGSDHLLNKFYQYKYINKYDIYNEHFKF
jgi:hypothetical protein